MLQKKFNAWVKEQNFWSNETKVLVAVSGGVDSMVLLELIKKMPQSQCPKIGVAHVNHQLRPESRDELKGIEQMCNRLGLPLYCYTWERKVDSESGNLEAEARDMRYRFFSKVYQEEGYDCLVTGHHGDDLAETLLMKLTKGTQLSNLSGLKPVTERLGMNIVRPLLPFSKEELTLFSEEERIEYFEDESNRDARYYRNRMRHDVLPLLKKEDPNLIKHLNHLAKQVAYTATFVDGQIQPILEKIVRKVSGECWEFELVSFLSETNETQYLVLTHFFQKVLIREGVEVNEKQVSDTLRLFQGEKSQGKIMLAGRWVIKKEYQKAYLEQSSRQLSTIENSSYLLLPDVQVQLNDLESVSLLSDTTKLVNAKRNQEVLDIYLDEKELPLTIRRRQAGDAIVFDHSGRHKKLRRVFIDDKIPQSIREKMWVVANSEQEVIGVFTIGKSYLSIKKETDKIHYRLVYLKEER